MTWRSSLACWLLCGLLWQGVRGGEPLPGTELLRTEGDLGAAMVAGIDRFLLAELAAAVERRPALWQRDPSSGEAYERSIAPNRARLARYVGAVDQWVENPRLEIVTPLTSDDPLPRGSAIGPDDTAPRVHRVQWPVFEGVTGEGLWIVPADAAAKFRGAVIIVPDADETPEQVVGLGERLSGQAAMIRRLVGAGLAVLVVATLDRSDEHSVVADRKTNEPHREFVYRQAFELGRHVIGYEVQMLRAAVEALVGEREGRKLPVGVLGYGEGGGTALYAAALEPRIQAVCVSGYFGDRQRVWEEPIYRNVWGLLEEFGDAELASLVAPRPLIVETSPAPQVTGPPAPRDGRGGAAPGRIVIPLLEEVTTEVARAKRLVEGLAWQVSVVPGAAGWGGAGAVQELAVALGVSLGNEQAGSAALAVHRGDDAAQRQARLVRQWVEHTQRLLHEAEYTRRDFFWSKLDLSSPEAYSKSTEALRETLARDVIGRFERRLLAPAVRTRQVYDEPRYTGYEVQMDVWPEVFACGILLVPKDVRACERRPCVVCQHGLEGRPQDVADPKVNNPAYNQYACRLAERGFVVYAPQNPYLGQDKFRTLQRKANLLRKTLFSFIVPQHQQATDWLASLPMVDPERIAFYGLSYGGKTAMRVPPLVERYCLSICSADFNEWIWKNASSRSPYSYVATGEYEIFEFNLGNTFNYAELAALIAPRPFMVERGHDDGVAPDEWVAYEYAKVRRLFTKLHLPERTAIEFFDGPHTIHGVGTFEFLHRHLQWPASP